MSSGTRPGPNRAKLLRASGCYSVLFEAPEGIRLEVSSVPGKGLFEAPAKLPLAEFAGSGRSGP